MEPNDDAATAGAVSGAFAVSGDLLGSADTFAWTIDDAEASSAWHLDASLTPGLGAYLDITAADGTPIARASSGYAGTSRIWDLRLEPGTYTVTLTSYNDQPPAYVLRAVAEPAQDIDAEPNDQMPQAIGARSDDAHAGAGGSRHTVMSTATGSTSRTPWRARCSRPR